MVDEMKIMLATGNKSHVDDMLMFLSTLDQNTRKSLLDFFQGAKLMQNLMSVAGGQTAVRSSG